MESIRFPSFLEHQGFASNPTDLFVKPTKPLLESFAGFFPTKIMGNVDDNRLRHQRVFNRGFSNTTTSRPDREPLLNSGHFLLRH